MTPQHIIEAALLSSRRPMPVREIRRLFDDRLSAKSVKEHLAELQAFWEDRGMRLVELSDGWRFQTASELGPRFLRLDEEKPPRYSRAAMETLAIIAYHHEDEEYLDLFNPESLEYFHQMRYIMLNKSLAVDPEYKYHNAAVADTQVFDTIRKLRSVSVIRCPQFFGMLEEESRFRFDKGERQFPKTYVPNVIMACIDTNKPIIKDIKLVEKGEMFNGYEEFI